MKSSWLIALLWINIASIPFSEEQEAIAA